jgi:hypothetical protein
MNTTVTASVLSLETNPRSPALAAWGCSECKDHLHLLDMPRQPSTPARFRQLAKECESLAREIEDPLTRQILIDLANRWRRLAEEDERRST